MTGVFDGLEQSAGSLRDYDRRLVRSKLLLDGGFKALEVKRILNSDSAHTDGMAESLKIDLNGRLLADCEARGGVILVACHAGDGVIEDDNGIVAFIVNDVDKTCYARMDKGRIADNGDELL